MKLLHRPSMLLLSALLIPLLIVGCESDLREDPTARQPSQGATNFTLALGSQTVVVVEGQGLVEVPVTISRTDEHTADIVLTVSDQAGETDEHLVRQFSDDTIDAEEQGSLLQLDLSISPLPIQAQTRTLLLRATDTNGASTSQELSLEIQPTSAPDVYLLIGQSNMVGISEDNAKQSGLGQIDEPVTRIRQLNVTFNDQDNFSSEEDFTNPEKIHNTGNPLSIALDPLHTGLSSSGEKSGTRIGLGLSFAKRALQDTTAEIYLVPAAWSDTGFCKRDTAPLDGLGWNASTKNNSALSGTLLFQRAVARTNVALTETGGVLRGILWHQGEADSEDDACAQTYAANLTELIQALRQQIQPDARGLSARTADAKVPFILGTMAMGGGQAPFSEAKLLVDSAHRNVASAVEYSDFVNNDDLIPPAYPCGGGSCIHFGADALREMGSRYYERLQSVLQ